MERKDFLVKASLAVFAVSACGMVKKQEDSASFSGECTTTDDILGPFYRPNAPQRRDLRIPNVPGSSISSKVKVVQADCKSGLKNALVEIWHCDTAGVYDNDTDDFRHRASWLTDENGAYEFKTILPGKYLNGRLYRPAHIHFRVTGENHKELVSQIYFSGDPHITEDPWASKPKAEKRILPIILEDTKGNLVVNFDIFMTGDK